MKSLFSIWTLRNYTKLLTVSAILSKDITNITSINNDKSKIKVDLPIWFSSFYKIKQFQVTSFVCWVPSDDEDLSFTVESGGSFGESSTTH